jgi:ubiquinone biosynthesis protein COQ4
MDVNLNSKTLFAFIQLLPDPGRIEAILGLAKELNLANPQTRDEVVARLRSHPRAAAALAERPRIGDTDLSKLAQLPEGTLGRIYADGFLRNNLNPSDVRIPTLPLADDRDYAVVHMNETHDVWHVVTGFGTDIAGELGLQAFYAAQLNLNLPHAILAAGFVNTFLFAWGDRHRRLSAICRGYILGLHADLLFGVPWASWLERPLAEVRRDLKIDLSLVEQMLPG